MPRPHLAPWLNSQRPHSSVDDVAPLEVGQLDHALKEPVELPDDASTPLLGNAGAGCRGVIAMDLKQIDVVGPQPGQLVFDLLQDVLAGQAALVWACADGVSQLGRNDDLVPIGEIREGAAEDLFAGTVRIEVRRIEQIDADVQRVLDRWTTVVLVE